MHTSSLLLSLLGVEDSEIDIVRGVSRWVRAEETVDCARTTRGRGNVLLGARAKMVKSMLMIAKLIEYGSGGGEGKVCGVKQNLDVRIVTVDRGRCVRGGGEASHTNLKWMTNLRQSQRPLTISGANLVV